MADSDDEQEAKKQKVERTYQWLSKRDHLLQRPAMVLGSTVSREFFYWNLATGEVRQETAVIVPAAMKLLDEVLANAYDNWQRDPTTSTIRVSISREAGGMFSVTNNGETIPIKEMEGTGLYLSTVLCSRFGSGSNFDVAKEGSDKKEKETATTIGQNGYGLKAVNTFSKKLTLKTCNPDQKKTFEQTWSDNMGEEGPPRVLACSRKTSETTVAFLVDWERLNMPECVHGLSPEVAGAFESLVFQASLCAPPSVKVYLNDKEVKMRTPAHFATAMGAVSEKGKPLAVDNVTEANGNPLFSICIGARAPGSPAVFEAFVNGSRCEGTLVDFVLQRVRKIVQDKLRTKKDTSDVTVKTANLRAEMVCVVTATLKEPQFDSQAKTCCTSNVPKSTWPECSAAFKANIEKSELVSRALSVSMAETDAKLSKTTKPKGTGRVDVANYDGAVHAGKKGENCTLILTEGLSAKSLAVAGLAVVGRAHYGVYPLKGKPMNVRNEKREAWLANVEMGSLIKILGLQLGLEYTEETLASLRYQQVLIMSDQDVDGDHICGLVLNNLVHMFPSVFRIKPNFVRRLATPVIRVSLPGGGERKNFFSEVEYRAWRQERIDAGMPTGKAQYYKGLGTSTAADAREYFTNIRQNTIEIHHTGAPADKALVKWFHKDKAEERRDFLQNEFDPECFIDYSQESVDIPKFIFEGVTQFSHADNRRSIPSAVDGLKPGQRKILFTMRERNMFASDYKVVLLCGAVLERAEYHHGEASLAATIVGLAQDYGFANNLALLVPSGQFGTRNAKHDEASPRYIFTRLHKIVKCLFRAEDDAVIEHLVEEGRSIEPRYYVPLIPMCLVNGTSGIGTGWRMESPSYKPEDVLTACRRWLELTGATTVGADGDADMEEQSSKASPVTMSGMVPWYRNYTGSIDRIDERTFNNRGVYSIEGNNVHITDLTINTKTDDYVEDLKKRLLRSGDTDDRFVDHIQPLSSDTNVLIILHSTAQRLEKVKDKLPELLKMNKKVHMERLNLFAAGSHRPELFTVDRIVDEFAQIRIETYAKRLKHLISEETASLQVARNKMRYISMQRPPISLNASEYKSKDALCTRLQDLEFDKRDGSYDYLVKMPGYTVTDEEHGKLTANVERIEAEIARLSTLTPREVWSTELDELEKELAEYDADKAQNVVPAMASGQPLSKAAGKRKKPSKAQK